MRVPRISLGKLFNVLQSPIGRMASWPMRNIKTFPSKQMYLYLSLVERKEAEFYHNIDRRRYLVWFKWLIFQTIAGILSTKIIKTANNNYQKTPRLPNHQSCTKHKNQQIHKTIKPKPKIFKSHNSTTSTRSPNSAT